MTIRVLEIVTNMGRGGIETMLMNYYRHIDRNQVQLDFLVHRQERAVYDDEIESLGGRIFRLPKLNPLSIKYQKCLNDFFVHHPEYRIVHCHLDCMAGIPLHAAKKNKIPVRIAHAHSSNQTKNIKFPIKFVCKSRISKQATILMSCSETAGKWMFNGAPFTVMHNAIDSTSFHWQPEIRAAVQQRLFPDKQNPFIVGHVGSFWSPKNHEFLLDIFYEIHRREPNSCLLLVGTGGLMDAIKEKARRLDIYNSITFFGDSKDVNQLMQAMDAFVFPSLYEGLGIVAVEAQAAGLPCFISDKVPLECAITDLVTQIPLSAPAEQWAEKILAARGRERTNTYSQIVEAGFDIVDQAKRLQNFYLEQWKAAE